MSSNSTAVVFYGMRTTQDFDRILSRIKEALDLEDSNYDEVISAANKAVKLFRCKLVTTEVFDYIQRISLTRFDKSTSGEFEAPKRFDPTVAKKQWTQDIQKAAKKINWPVRDRKAGWFITSGYG